MTSLWVWSVNITINIYPGIIILKIYTKKLTEGIFALCRVKPFVNKETFISIYNAIIRPQFDYCCEVWDALGKTQSDQLQKLQNRAA